MGLNILVADDDQLMRTFFTVSLQSGEAVQTKEAADGREALELFEREPFDLVILDWNMPGPSGLDVLRTIRARDRQVPVIMVTTEADREHVLKAVHLGANDCLIKPCESESLRAKVDKLCR